VMWRNWYVIYFVWRFITIHKSIIFVETFN
jgi:hypothetical protein